MHLVIGTAGHIDHGKSTLVRALTGIDPDRLKEEKARGITIDLGFAHAQVGALRLAFVDVPGHERFVRNMLAGATGIDAVLLVVAADESVMPQTREHFAICRLLDVRAGVVALTKSDVADPELLEIARMDVQELVAGSFLDGAPIVPVSGRTGEGLDALRAALAALAPRAAAREHDGATRLPIDRAFTMRGFGAVVTGTLQAGRMRVDEELMLLPAGRPVRVRGLQVHGDKVAEATGGQRVAVNLSDVEASAIARGDTLVTPGAFEPTVRLDATLELLPDARPLAHGTRVRVHLGTSEVLGRVAVAEVTRRAGDVHAGEGDPEGPYDTGYDAAERRADAGRARGTHADVGHADLGRAGVEHAKIGRADVGHGDVGHDNVGRADVGHGDVAYADVRAATRRDARAASPSASTSSRVVTIVPPGGRARVRLRLEAPVVATRGDRFVLRAYSPVVTIGGGVVLDPQPARSGLRTPAGRARFAALDPEAVVSAPDSYEADASGLDARQLQHHAGDAAVAPPRPRGGDQRHAPSSPDAGRVRQGGEPHLQHHAGDAAVASPGPLGEGQRDEPSSPDTRAALVMLEEAGRAGLPVAAFGTRLGLRGDAIEAMAARLAAAGYAVRIGDLLVSRVVVDRLADALVAQVRRHHEAQPDSEGLPREEVRDRLGVTPRVFDTLVDRLTSQHAIGGRDRLALPSHRAAVPDADAAALARVETVLRNAGLKPPDVADLAQQAALAAATLDRLINFLVRQKRLVRLGALVFHQDALTLMKDDMRTLKAAAAGGRATVDVASFKTRYDMSRKYAIPLLEYLDRERVTRRVGDERIVL